MALLRAERDPAVRAACAVTRRASRSFALACRLLPRAVRGDVYLLYGAFRSLDDLVDEERQEAEERVAAVEAWARGSADRSPEARAFARVDARHGVPRGALVEFCLGMRDDLAGARPRTEADLDRYCYRVAGSVGIVMCSLLGARGPEAERRAAALGMAMQRTNILRDIDEDLDRGRIYLAAETLARHPELRHGSREPLLRKQIDRAEVLYEEGVRGIPSLARGRRAVAAATAIYREILRQIERDGFARGRAVVPARRRVALALRHGLAPPGVV
jgi:phytoene synthase